MQNNGKLKVLCTTAQIADVVQKVGREKIDCLTLIQGESDPHSYQLVKGDDEKIARADLIFYNGLGLEHGPSLSERLRSNPKAHSVGDFLAKTYPNSIIWYKGSVDPHVWMDVSLWAKTVPFIAETLAQNSTQELSASLDALHNEVVTKFSAIPESSRYLVTSHEAFNYFVRAYLATDAERENNTWQVRSMAPEGLAPDSQLSTADIKRLVDHIIEFHVKTLFAESNVSQDSLKKLADVCRRKGHEVRIATDPLYVDAMGPPGANYSEMMRYDAEQIAKGM
jgi:manganese/zinc/iron transport system substrate-binding protein